MWSWTVVRQWGMNSLGAGVDIEKFNMPSPTFLYTTVKLTEANFTNPITGCPKLGWKEIGAVHGIQTYISNSLYEAASDYSSTQKSMELNVQVEASIPFFAFSGSARFVNTYNSELFAKRVDIRQEARTQAFSVRLLAVEDLDASADFLEAVMRLPEEWDTDNAWPAYVSPLSGVRIRMWVVCLIDAMYMSRAYNRATFEATPPKMFKWRAGWTSCSIWRRLGGTTSM